MNIYNEANALANRSTLQQGFTSPSIAPVKWFAGFGLLCSIYGLYAMIVWLLSPDLKPIDPGPDPLPQLS